MRHVITIALVALSLSPAAALAAPGDLDPSFDGDGKRVLPFPAVPKAVLLQPDGKILVAGTASGDFAVWRFNTDGSLDRSFGGDGAAAVDIGANDELWAAALQPDGKVVVAGITAGSTSAVARFTAGGALDATFAPGGDDGDGKRLLYDLDLWGVRAVLAQPDGRIVVVGQFDDNFVLLRLKENGAPDDTAFEPADFGGREAATAAGLTPTGEIVVAGTTYKPPMLAAGSQVALARYTADGKLDKTLAGTGKLSFGADGNDDPWSVAVRPDGGVLVAGTNSAGDSRTFVTPVSREGVADVAFAAAASDFDGPDGPVGAALRPDGRIVVAATAGYDVAVAQLTPAGELHAAFGTAGRDTLRGTRRADVILALGGADRVLARGGNDLVCGGAGNDRLSGGAGRDRLLGERGRDRLDGGRGRDRLVGGPGRDRARQ